LEQKVIIGVKPKVKAGENESAGSLFLDYLILSDWLNPNDRDID
jgi:hypothetical protein